MQRWSRTCLPFCLVVLVGVTIGGSSRLAPLVHAQSPAAPERTKPLDVPVEPRAPGTVKEGAPWVPPMPTMDQVAPPPGWQQPGAETPAMPLTLLRLPRTNVWRAKYPALDFHVHAGGLTSTAAYDALVALMDDIGMGAIVNLNGGTGAQLDAVLAAGAEGPRRELHHLQRRGHQ